MKNIILAGLIITALTWAACREVYTPPVTAIDTKKILVIEGYISVGNSPTSVSLTHATKLGENSGIQPESGATVVVQSDDGNNYPLNETAGGVYTIPAINGNTAAKYRIAITTLDGNQYQSDYVEYKQTPVIDSIGWEEEADGVHIYANAHDDAALTKYYGWSYVETYEYHAPFQNLFKVVDGKVLARPPEEQVYQCWQTVNSSRVLIASSANLSKDIISKKEIAFIPANTEKIGVLYSILVSQHALTKEYYNYWLQISKNTENLGSLFDAQPSQAQGNIHCTTDKSQVVIGFMAASSLQQKRLFIDKHQLSNWQYPPSAYAICDTIHLTPANMAQYFSMGYEPVGYYAPFLYFATSPGCADCTLKGGTPVKPPFWP